ncbi:MAG: adenylate/guanylate cyclase domain-containing protein [Oxalicibacterium faecigallinarum]|uniref:adenylate/guanylate cyclase domain-containing protein n=1 Tax=Oxalicibacterium faecigallinarum TaxID=573741 RepID=UPI0028092369|nr:adenylate/guanylate cyclase domain-containing protein [Oxalicibacterium faecigallinarum]MDQ7968445.1 adenylate/guanylate cyclase domain-containing protein [Oxalicibacterium faecigallinarum]
MFALATTQPKKTRAFRLHITITFVFVLLTLPVTAIFGFVTYRSNQQLIVDHTERFIQKSRTENASNISNLLGPIMNTVRTATTLMRDNSDYFLSESSADYLQEITVSHPGVTSAYATFDTGSFHEVRRASVGELIMGEKIPATTQFVSRFIDASNGTDYQGLLIDNYTFQAPWGVRVGEATGSAVDDPRLRRVYKESNSLKFASVSEPYLLSNSGQWGITLAAPVIINDRSIGVISADFTLKALSDFFAENKTTANSITILSDESGLIIAHPQFEEGLTKKGEGFALNRIDKLPDARVLTALGERTRNGQDSFKFRAGSDDKEYLALFTPFPKEFNKQWQILTITPTDDFVGKIRRTNRNLLLFSVLVFLLQVTLIYMISRMIARPIEQLALEVMNIREFRFDKMVKIRSSVSEISYLSDAIILLERALASFASYVPTVLVKQLMDSGQASKLGVESRFLTVLFTDIERFSSLSESEPSQQLLSRVSEYFGTMTRAVEKEQGTVDKFIGDAVMAFWGAPKILDNHAYLACVAAVRAQRGMARLNAQWIAEKHPPLNVRIGIHCDAVLVGNIGSAERISYSVMGDGVNVAARLEGLNKEMGTWTCVSHNVFREAGHLLWLRPIDTVAVKGRKSEFLVYELLGIKDNDAEVAASESDVLLCELTQQAYNAYAAADFESAVVLYEAVLNQFPDDRVALRMLEKSRTACSQTAGFDD